LRQGKGWGSRDIRHWDSGDALRGSERAVMDADTCSESIHNDGGLGLTRLQRASPAASAGTVNSTSPPLSKTSPASASTPWEPPSRCECGPRTGPTPRRPTRCSVRCEPAITTAACSLSRTTPMDHWSTYGPLWRRASYIKVRFPTGWFQILRLERSTGPPMALQGKVAERWFEGASARDSISWTDRRQPEGCRLDELCFLLDRPTRELEQLGQGLRGQRSQQLLGGRARGSRCWFGRVQVQHLHQPLGPSSV